MKLNHLTFGLIILLSIASCSKDDDANPDPLTKANITGFVNLYNESTTQINNANMTVKVEGLVPPIIATTNANGSFTLADVPFGTHTIVYEKPGFGTFKKFNILHENTDTVLTNIQSLGESSTTQATALTVNTAGNVITFSITTTPGGSNGNRRYVRYFLSTNSNVSNENYTHYSAGLTSQINPFETTISQNELINAGFTSGQTVHVKAYGDSFWSNEYDDPTLSRRIFPNLNATSTNTASFIVP